MIKNIKIIIITILLSSFLFATEYNAASGSLSDVTSAYNSCSDGDTVLIPEATVTWSDGLDIRDKDVTILGAGQGVTVITYSGANAWNAGCFHVDNDAGDPKDDFEIGHMTIIEGMGNRDTGGMAVSVWDAGPDWRIHHLTVTDAYNGNMIYIGRYQGSNSGVVDHCIFNATNGSGHTKAFQINAKDIDTETGGGDPSVSYGSTSWTTASSFGTKEALYIENCTFNWTAQYSGADMDEGARVVWRYNTFIGTGPGSHGDDGGNTDRGVRHYEIYENTFDGNGVGLYAALRFRGGTGVIYNNEFSGNYGSGIILYCYCAHSDCGPCSSFPEPCSYPCSGQIGQGPDDTTDPLYLWNNTWNDGLGISVRSCTNIGNIIQENRDYFADSVKVGYTAYDYPHPLSEGNDVTPPTATGNLTANGYDSMDVAISSISADCDTLIAYYPDSTTVLDTLLTTANFDTTVYVKAEGAAAETDSLYYWAIDDSSNVTSKTFMDSTIVPQKPNDETPPIGTLNITADSITVKSKSADCAIDTTAFASTRYDTTSSLVGGTEAGNVSRAISTSAGNTYYAYWKAIDDSSNVTYFLSNEDSIVIAAEPSTGTMTPGQGKITSGSGTITP